MGRRAKKAPVQTKKRPTLAKRFKCPFCANEEVVECKMDNKKGVGSLNCRLCAASYQMPIHHLHEPIDVFSEWLDDCEAAANGGRAPGAADNGNAGEGAAPRFNEEDDEDDDDLPQSIDLSKGKKRPAQDTGAKKKQKTGKDESKTYTTLGLDDSDSDSDED